MPASTSQSSSHLSIMTMQSKCKSRAELAKLAWVIMPRCSFAYPKLAPIHLHALIWFVIHPLWFVNTAFCTSKHPTTVKNTRQTLTFLPKLLHNSNKSRTFASSVLAKPLNNAQIVRGVFCLYTQLIPSITIGFRILMENTTSMKNTTEPSL